MTGTYKKVAPGEELVYQSPNLPAYQGKHFCFRITLGDSQLDSCFYLYLDESEEQLTLYQILNKYFWNPTYQTSNLLDNKFVEYKKQDETLKQKYLILRKLFAKVGSGEYKAEYHINHGPSFIPLTDLVSLHLGTSIWDNGQYNDKILDVVVDFKDVVTEDIAKEQALWVTMGEKVYEEIYGKTNPWMTALVVLGLGGLVGAIVYALASDKGYTGGTL